MHARPNLPLPAWRGEGRGEGPLETNRVPSDRLRSDRASTVVTIAAVALVAACAVAFALTSFQQDCAAYWVAGAAWRAGLDPYANNAAAGARVPWDGSLFRHSRFLYPPLAAELMRPLAALPYRAAKLLFTACAVAAWIAAAALLARGRRVSAAMLGAGALFFPLYFHLERGQIDLLLLPLVLAAWRVKHRPALAGALFAAAGTIKPALLGALPAIAALGHRRWAAWTIGGAAAALLATVLVSGPALVREYAGVVLPRAALYGEGGTDAMALHERDIDGLSGGGDGDSQAIASSEGRLSRPEHIAGGAEPFEGSALIDGRLYRYVVPLFDRPASASLPRLLAPESPSWPTSLLPYLLAAGAMIWAGRRVARRADGSDDDAQLALFVAALVACVVASPTGWVMGFVWALPLAPLVLRIRAAVTTPPWWLRAVVGAWIVCALPAPFAGWPAMAGVALAVAAGAVAIEWPRA